MTVLDPDRLPEERKQFVAETFDEVAADGGDFLDVVRALFELPGRDDAERFWAYLEWKYPRRRPLPVKAVHREADITEDPDRGRRSLCGSLIQSVHGGRDNYSDAYMSRWLTTDPEQVTCSKCAAGSKINTPKEMP